MSRRMITADEFVEMLRSHNEWIASFLRRDDPRGGTRIEILDSDLQDIKLRKVVLQCCIFSRCRLTRVKLEECDLIGSRFYESVFRDCEFVRCDIYKSELHDDDFTGTNFSGSDLTRVEMFGSMLAHTDLTDAVFDWSTLIRTDMRYANLKGTSFRNARVDGVRMYNDRKFRIGSIEGIKIFDKGIDMSPSGDSSLILGIDAFKQLEQD